MPEMDRTAAVAAVKERLRAMPGVVDVKVLDPGLETEVRRMEARVEENGACGGLVPFVNRGVWEALDREVSIIIVGNAQLLAGAGGDLLRMVDRKGQVVGEYVLPHQREAVLERDPRAHFLSDDFCLHPDVVPEGEPYILIGEVDFPYLDGIEGVSRVTSGSLSALTDGWVRNALGHGGPGEWTHLVGFDLSWVKGSSAPWTRSRPACAGGRWIPSPPRSRSP